MKVRTSAEVVFALLFAACVLLALLLLTGCKESNAVGTDPGPQVVGQSVIFPEATQVIDRFDVQRVTAPADGDLRLPGRLVWNEERTVRVFPPFAGRVTRILANVGDHVAANQPLAEIISPDFGQAQADARKAQADLSLSTQALRRQQELHDHGVASAKDLQQAQADQIRAQAEADRALGRLSAYGQAVSGESRFVLKSPMGGVVVERNINPGQELRSDQGGPAVFVVTDPSQLWISIDAREGDLRSLRGGLPLVVTSSQLPEESFEGTLRQVSDFVDPVTRTVKLRGDVPNPKHELRAEMFVTARVHVPKRTEPTVDARAVYLAGGRHYVFVLDRTTFTRRPVEVGPEENGRTPVISGLKVGEQVATSGNLVLDHMLGDAASVQYIEEKAPEKAPGS